jgi:putative lipoprotein
MRLAEAYLNRAEAYARLNQPTEAVRDMTDLLSKRYLRSSGFDIPEETEELLDFIQKERRKELCYEEHHRWFDLRRMRENAPEVVHAFTITDESGIIYGTQYYTLFPGELNYTLPLPLKERDNNPLIQNNERYDKLPETNDEIVIP